MIRTSNKRIEEIFRALGISAGDKIMIHADLRIFGYLENMGEDFLQILEEIIGPSGSMITPSFTFSFPNTFNINTTVSTTGAIGKLFAKQKNVKRVPDGMTSYYLIGGDAEKMIQEWGHSSYGENSIPDQLTRNGGKILQLGTDILSLVHYLEEKISVPYREIIRFEGRIEDGEKRYDSYTNFYARKTPVRKLIPDPIRSVFYEKCDTCLIFNSRPCRVFSCKEYLDFSMPRLEADKMILIER